MIHDFYVVYALMQDSGLDQCCYQLWARSRLTTLGELAEWWTCETCSVSVGDRYLYIIYTHRFLQCMNRYELWYMKVLFRSKDRSIESIMHDFLLLLDISWPRVILEALNTWFLTPPLCYLLSSCCFHLLHHSSRSPILSLAQILRHLNEHKTM